MGRELKTTHPTRATVKAPSQEGPQAFGVDSIVELPDTQESKDESDGEKPEESFL